MKLKELLETCKFFSVRKVVIWRGTKLLSTYNAIHLSREDALKNYGDNEVKEFDCDPDGYWYIRLK